MLHTDVLKHEANTSLTDKHEDEFILKLSMHLEILVFLQIVVIFVKKNVSFITEMSWGSLSLHRAAGRPDLYKHKPLWILWGF